MISIVKIGNLEVKKKERGDGFREYAVFDGDDVVLSDAHFKEAIDFVNQYSQDQKGEVASKDLAHHLPEGIEAVFLYDRDTAQIEASLTREEAELIFQEEMNCIPKIHSIIMMSPQDPTVLLSKNLKEKFVHSVELIGLKTLIIFLGEP